MTNFSLLVRKLKKKRCVFDTTSLIVGLQAWLSPLSYNNIRKVRYSQTHLITFGPNQLLLFVRQTGSLVYTFPELSNGIWHAYVPPPRHIWHYYLYRACKIIGHPVFPEHLLTFKFGTKFVTSSQSTSWPNSCQPFWNVTSVSNSFKTPPNIEVFLTIEGLGHLLNYECLLG